MFDANVVARSHFTRKVDQESSFWAFLKEVHLLDSGLEWKFSSGIVRNGNPVYYVAESWGGYVNADNEWVIFVCWRTPNGKLTKYSHWSWDSENKMPFGRRDMGYCG